MEENILVAVYGSLRKDLHNHKHFLEDSTYVGFYNTEPVYTLYDLGSYPGLVDKGNTSVVMEVYEVTSDVLSSLDGLEGYHGRDKKNNHYNRELIPTPFGIAFTYIYNSTPSGNKVLTGDWTEHITFKQNIRNAQI